MYELFSGDATLEHLLKISDLHAFACEVRKSYNIKIIFTSVKMPITTKPPIYILQK